MFLVEGTIYAHGTIDKKITFDGGGLSYTKFFWNYEDYDYTAFVDLDYCIIKNGGNIWDGGYGHFNLRHSEVINLKACSSLWYPKRDLYIEYNKFINSGCFEILQSEANVYIRNNLFIGKAVDEFYLIHTGASYGNSVTIVQYNSFIDISDKVLSIGNEGIMNTTENYWGTLDTSIIDSMIWDRHDSILCENFIEYLPILTEPHPDTPILLEDLKVNINGSFKEDNDGKWRCYTNITIKNNSYRNVTISWVYLNAINITYIDETFEELNISGNETLNYVIQPEQEFSVRWTITTFGFAKEPKILWVLFKTPISEAYATITLTTVIPEFSIITLLALFIIMSMLVAIFWKEKLRRYGNGVIQISFSRN